MSAFLKDFLLRHTGALEGHLGRANTSRPLLDGELRLRRARHAQEERIAVFAAEHAGERRQVFGYRDLQRREKSLRGK